MGGSDRREDGPRGVLAGRVAVITGAGGGIGRASVALFLAEGARVLAVDAAASVHGLADGRPGLETLQADAGDEAEVAALVARAIARFGRIDVAFANAGILGGMQGLFEQDAGDWAEILRVNLIGPFLLAKYAAPHMAGQGGGAILCTASTAGLRSGAGGAAYSASKAGVINFVQTAAQQLAGSNVRVNAICPGLVETGMTQALFDRARAAGKADRIGQLNPLRRAGAPEEIARAALFLASDAASYVNGQALVVDGGLSSSHPVTRQDYGRVAL